MSRQQSLTAETVRAIRESELSPVDIARKLNIHYQIVYNVLNYRSYVNTPPLADPNITAIANATGLSYNRAKKVYEDRQRKVN